MSWPIVVLECTSLPSTVTSKLPVVPGSWISSIAISSPNSPVSVEASAVKYFLYPHPPQYWIETLTADRRRLDLQKRILKRMLSVDPRQAAQVSRIQRVFRAHIAMRRMRTMV